MGKKIVRLTESDLARIVKRVLSESNEDNKSFEVITNEWNKLPENFSGYLVFYNWVDLRTSLIPNGDELKTYFTANKDNLTANGYVSFTNNGVNYLLAVDIDSGQVGAGECTVKKGKAEEYNGFNRLPKGSTEYVIINKIKDSEYSLLGALINGTPCWTHLSKSLTGKYGHLSNCWK
jgi:hypothetical protein